MNKEPIRIAHIVGKMVGGGVESFLMNYYKNIDKNQVQFDFIIDSDSLIVPREEIEKYGGRIIEIPPYQHIFKYIKSLRKILKENNYKIVHSHLNTLSVFPLFCAYTSKVPVRIAHSHSTTNKKEWKKNILKNILKPFSKIFATHYFACSEHAGRWLFGNKVFEQGKVTIIHNAIDIEKFKYDEEIRNRIRKELKIEDKFVLGHVGRFVQQKNHDFIIDVFNEVQKNEKNAVLLLIGEGPLEEKIKYRVKNLGLEDKVHFLGIRTNVNELIQAMDSFIFPSLYEGFGIVLIESQISGLYCFASTEVPEEAKVTDNISFISLDKNSKYWGDYITKNFKKISRKEYTEQIANKGYDIKTECKKLEKIYLGELNQHS